MLYFILSLLIISQVYTLIKINSYSKSKKESDAVIEKYKGVTTLAKIPERVYYKDVEPDWKTFYDFMENIKLEGWKAEVTEDQLRIDRDSCWVVNLTSHDGNSVMSVRLRDYGDGIFLSSCNIRAGGTSLSVSKEEKIATDIILFIWDYIIEHYESMNNDSINSYKDSINRINAQLKTLNRSKRLNNILEL
jgi:hypothetical protein